MKNLRIETSVMDAKKAYEALNDSGILSGSDALIQEASNVWVTPEYDEEEYGEYPGDEFATEQLKNFGYDIEDVFSRYGVKEYTIEVV